MVTDPEKVRGRKENSMDLTTLGVTFGYGVETTAGTKPTTFKQLQRCNNISGISMETEQIDVSALEDYTTRYAEGRQDTGGTWEVTFNMSAETIAAIEELYEAAATAKESGLSVWFQVMFPDLTDAFFVVAATGRAIPLPDIAQNEAATLPITLVISDYKGLDTKVDWSEE